MQRKKSAGKRIGDFIAGKGFYIVLVVCAAVIGVSAWALFFTDETQNGTDVEPVSDLHTPVFIPTPDKEDVFTIFSPEPAATATPEATPDVTPEATPETAEDTEPEPTPVSAPSPTPTPTPVVAVQDDEGGNTAKSLDEMTFIKPVAGDVIKPYAADELVYNRTLGVWRVHPGVDLAGAIGLHVVAVTDGTVTRIERDDLLGTMVVIDCGFGLETIYCNLAAEPVVRVGDKVTQGAVIGAIGDTAVSEIGDVSHLHFAMTLNSEYVDPAEYLNLG